jgi:hypothetical protein
MRYIIFLLLLFLTEPVFSQPGKYAGQQKYLIGKVYTDSRNIEQLKTWKFQGGSLVNPIDDPEIITVDVFSKGNTWIVFFSIKEDTAASSFMIMDVVEVKNVMKDWQLRTTFCRSNKNENPEIVALVKKSTVVEFLKPAKKVWRFNRDKRRFEIISATGIDCINEALN